MIIRQVTHPDMHVLTWILLVLPLYALYHRQIVIYNILHIELVTMKIIAGN